MESKLEMGPKVKYGLHMDKKNQIRVPFGCSVIM